jgi:hypothetical protein
MGYTPGEGKLEAQLPLETGRTLTSGVIKKRQLDIMSLLVQNYGKKQ